MSFAPLAPRRAPRALPPGALGGLLSIAAAALALSGGCGNLRDFLVPPPSRGVADVGGGGDGAPFLAIDDVLLPDEATPVSVGVRAGRVVAISRGAPLAARAGLARRFDARGLRALPARTDGHIHLEGAALLRDAAVLKGDAASQPAALGAALRVHGSGGPWTWALGAQPALVDSLDAASLQQLAGDEAIWLSAADGHAAVLSERACALLPPALRARAAARRCRLDAALAREAWRAMPRRASRVAALIVAELRDHAARGVVEVHAMAESVATLRLLEALDAVGRIPLRVLVYLDAEDPATGPLIDALGTTQPVQGRRPGARSPGAQPEPSASTASARPPARGPARREADESRLVRLQGVKLYADGSLGAASAALGAPYADGRPAPPPLCSAADVGSWLRRCDAAGLQLAVHAIGDAALQIVLDGAASVERAADALPLRVEHAQVVTAAQLPRLRGHLCSIQPLHRRDDAGFADQRLGAGRAADAYRAASLAGNCRLLLGSDAPIGAPDPAAMVDELSGMEALSGGAAAPRSPRPTAERLSASDVEVLLQRYGPRAADRRIAIGEIADLRLVDAEGRLRMVFVQGRLAATMHD